MTSQKNNSRIAVTSSSFSLNLALRTELLKHFSNVVFNEGGKKLSPDQIRTMMGDAVGAIIGLEKVDTEFLLSAPKLKVISKYGVGVDNIVFEDCEKAGVKVVWTPGVNAFSVAEQALGMMIALSRNLFSGSTSLKNGQWVKDGGSQVGGKTVGVIGVGNIGRKMIELLKPFGCRLLANDIEDRSEFCSKHGVVLTSKEEIFAAADIVSLHVPLTPQTHHLVGRKFLGLMKPTALLINTSRGPIVQQEALHEALRTVKIRGAALDVYEEEPPSDMDFLRLPNLICTPHICGNSAESVLAMGKSAVENLQKELIL